MHTSYSQAQELFEYTQALRRDFHRHPELGFQEVRTSGVVARELRELGLEVTTGIAKTGVVAMLEGEKPGPVVLLRFDMDALPISEKTGAEYASVNPGVMHACGHDGHTAVGLTVARMLHARRAELVGSVKLVFQPAEEGLGGAEGMVAAGVLQDPRPDYALALHLWNNEPFGWLGVAPGPTLAAAGIFSIHITGKGGHGAMPHLAVDPQIASAHLVIALQSVVSRNVSPLQSAVVSVTSVHGGDTFNVIPQEVELQGTIRTFESEVRELVFRRFQEVVDGMASTFGCQMQVEFKSITPAVVNDPEITARIQSICQEVSPDSELDMDFRAMGSEDMAFMMQDVPGCYIAIGSANPENGLDFPHHHPRFDFDERALSLGAAVMTTAVLEKIVIG